MGRAGGMIFCAATAAIANCRKRFPDSEVDCIVADICERDAGGGNGGPY